MRGCGDVSVCPILPSIPIALPKKGCTHVLRRIVRDVADEGDLVALALAARSIVLDVVDGVTAANALGTLAVLALGVDQLLAEGVVVGLGGGLLDDDLLVVIGKLVDDPLSALAKLEFVELLDALGSDGDTVRMASIAEGSWLARHGNREERQALEDRLAVNVPG